MDYKVEFSVDGKNWHELEGVVMGFPALDWDRVRPACPKPIWRNAGVPYAVPPGYQFGSVDHFHSDNVGYRKHSNVLRIEAKRRHEKREAEVPRGQYDYAVSQFYID